MTHFIERLETVICERGLKPVDLAKIAGVTKGAVSQWMNPPYLKPGARSMAKLANGLNVEALWLSEGEGPKEKSTLSETNEKPDQHLNIVKNPLNVSLSKSHDDEIDIIFVRDVDLTGSKWESILNGRGTDMMRFSKSFFEEKQKEEKDVICVRVSGNSMEPRLNDGDTVAVDTSETGVVDGKVYAVNNDGLLQLRRVYRMPGRGFKLNTFNQSEYSDQIINSAQAKDIKILGRVFWSSTDW